MAVKVSVGVIGVAVGAAVGELVIVGAAVGVTTVSTEQEESSMAHNRRM